MVASNNVKVGIIGAGYVGLPLAASFARLKFMILILNALPI